MTNRKVSLFEVKGDRVVGTAGDSSEETRSRFAREAEGLQARAYQVGLAIGMSSLSCSAVACGSGSLAFRFARTSAEEFDARGVLVDEEQFSVSSLHKATES
ncbi:MAG: hypothetical protein CMO55_02680 [Verrucomicrobiales bacterium]|nr:hypothetical protein [Verrucomicrobiales bacterium]